VAGANGTRSLQWVAKCAESARSVGLITTPSKLGTGFLVRASALDKDWKSKDCTVFLTNSHVTGTDDVRQMTVRFYGMKDSPEYKVEACLDSSVPQALDYAVLLLKDLPADAPWCPLAALPPTDSPTGRVYVMGYPDGGGLCVSLYDNTLVAVGDRTLHYTSNTKPGSSGSPVFDEDWQVVGLHHGTADGYFPDGIPYSAHEAIRLEAIWDRARLEPKLRPGG
jgi:hypothetical protein